MVLKIKFKAAAAIITVMALMLSPLTVNAAAETVLYETKKTTVVTSGVTYDEVTRMYDRGWLNIYALKIDAQNPNVKFNVISSLAETGLKETVQNLAETNGALAAVNGDFFGSTALASSMGIVIGDGKLKEARNYYNVANQPYAGLYINSQNVPFIDYFKVSHIGFLTNGASHIEIDAKNKITDMKKPVYIDRTAMSQTANLDMRFKDLYKITVENGFIKDISAAGTVVNVPENGFLIVMDAPTAIKHLKNFSVGDTAQYYENTQFHASSHVAGDIVFGISGGSKILESGVTKDDGLIVEPHKRHPRTVVGINKEKTQVVLIAIDGRAKNSIGATHYEAAEILREYGAWDAFHLDGGGSTTVVLRNEGDTALSVENTPSGGEQRKVANAVGLYSVNEPGQLTGIHLKSGGKKDGVTALATVPLPLTATGYDEHLNPVPLDNVAYFVNGMSGAFSGNSFIPESEGEAVITAESGGITAELNVKVLSQPVALRVTPATTTIKKGDTIQLKAELVNKDGYGVPVNAVWSVGANTGIIDANGKFTSTADGVTTITADYYGYKGHTSVASGAYQLPIASYANGGASFKPITEGVAGGAQYSTAITYNGGESLEINYAFKAGQNKPQQAAVEFTGAVVDGAPTAFGFWLTGDGAGTTVNAVFTDGTGTEKTYSFNQNMDNGNWKYYYGAFEQGTVYPLTLSKITFTSGTNLKNDVSAKLYLDTVYAAYSYKPEKGFMRFDLNDYKYTNIDAVTDGVNFAVFGPSANVSTTFGKDVFARVLTQMIYTTGNLIFAGYTEQFPEIPSANITVWNDTYYINNVENARIITLATSAGGMRQTNPWQWKSFVNDLNASDMNTIIVLNKEVWSNDGFSDISERDLLHKVLAEYKNNTDADVLVVSGDGYDTKSAVYDGIRYITLNGVATNEPPELSNINILRVNVSENGIKYDLVPVY